MSPTARPEGSYSPVFTSENSIALSFGLGACRLFVLKYDGAEWRVIGSTVTCGDEGSLYAVSGGKMIVPDINQNLLYSANLSESRRLPIRFLRVPASPGNATVGTIGIEGWKAYHLFPKFEQIQSGPGELLSVSDQFIVYRDQSVVHIITTGGVERGSYRVERLFGNEGQLIGENRLLRETGAHDEIVDFHGQRIQVLPREQGLACWRHGWSADRHRILFDLYTRHVPFFQFIWEALFRILTLGIGVVQDIPNGEIIRVIDIPTGKVCFDLTSSDHLLGAAYGYHADISPSGRLLVVLSAKEVSFSG